jgi:transcriptional regulator with XRE-family HTH domain
MILNKFGKRVRELRLEKGWSQEVFALECELDRTYISGLEKGRRNVSLKNVEKICKALGVSLNEFFNF